MIDEHEHDHDLNPQQCSEVPAELYTYLDGELAEPKRADIVTHLDDCSPCLEAFDFEAELRLVIRQRCRDEVPDALRQRIADSLAEVEAEAERELDTGPASSGADPR